MKINDKLSFIYTVGGDFDYPPLLKMTPSSSLFNLQVQGDGDVDGTYNLKIKNRNSESIGYVEIKDIELTDDAAYKVHNTIPIFGDMLLEVVDGTCTAGKILITIEY